MPQLRSGYAFAPLRLTGSHPTVSECQIKSRLVQLIRAMQGLGTSRALAVVRFARADIRRCFALLEARTKPEIAAAIAQHFPELAPRLPPKRKIWMSEDERMSIFDAVSLALTYFCHESEEGTVPLRPSERPTSTPR